MFFPYYHNITIEELYDRFTYMESSNDSEVRLWFRRLASYKWRVSFRSNLLLGKMNFTNFTDLYQFIKFAYIVYPNLCLTLFYQAK